MVAQGNALGFGIDRCALQGRRNPPPLQGGTGTSDTFPGVARGWHAPRPWCVNLAEFSIGETCYGPIYEVGLSKNISPFHVYEKCRQNIFDLVETRGIPDLVYAPRWTA